MKQTAMPPKFCRRNLENKCDGALCYYHEGSNGNDVYYCNRCYAIAEWDGDTVRAVDGEAYPKRDKSNPNTN